MKIPYEIQNTIEVTLMTAISRHWEWRKEKYWRDSLKRKIAALRFMRSL